MVEITKTGSAGTHFFVKSKVPDEEGIPCVFSYSPDRRITRAACSATTINPAFNKAGCCRSQCRSKMRACKACITDGAVDPKPSFDPITGLCSAHLMGVDQEPENSRQKKQREPCAVPGMHVLPTGPAIFLPQKEIKSSPAAPTWSKSAFQISDEMTVMLNNGKPREEIAATFGQPNQAGVVWVWSVLSLQNVVPEVRQLLEAAMAEGVRMHFRDLQQTADEPKNQQIQYAQIMIEKRRTPSSLPKQKR